MGTEASELAGEMRAKGAVTATQRDVVVERSEATLLATYSFFLGVQKAVFLLTWAWHQADMAPLVLQKRKEKLGLRRYDAPGYCATEDLTQVKKISEPPPHPYKAALARCLVMNIFVLVR